MRSFVLLFSVLLLAGCAGQPQTQVPATATPQAAATAPAATPALSQSLPAKVTVVEPTAAPAKATAPQLTTAQMAERFVRALYAGDEATARALYPYFKAEDRDEPKVHLDKLSVKALSAAEAGDSNPLTKWEYAEVTTEVSYQGKAGKATYKVGTLPNTSGQRLVNMIMTLGIQWN